MKNAIIHFALGFVLVLLPVLVILIWILKLPYSLWKDLKTGYLAFLTACPEEIRRILKGFDNNGLRHNIQYINDIKVRNQVAVMPVEQQCDFVDIRTHSSFYKDKPHPGNRQSLPIEIAGIEIQPLWKSVEHINISSANTTAIGNLAWMSLYHWDEDFRKAATDKLNEIREYYKQFV
jgi:hypothetical protein